MPLHLDYRPQNLDQIAGNEVTVESLRSIFVNREKDFPHAILFQGPKGCGKTTMARIISNILLDKPSDDCKADFIQMDGGDVKADTVELIKQQIRYKPQSAKCRIFLIDEAHMIGQGGDSNKNVPQNNMLTILENAPKHVYFIFTTTDPERLLGTIKSRCTTYEVRALTSRQTKNLLEDVLKKEDVSDIPSSILNEIINVSDGCPREALKILDQIIDMPLDKMSEAVQDFRSADRNTADLVKGLLNKDSWDRIRTTLKRMDLSNPENVRLAIFGWMASEVMKGENPLAAIIADEFKSPFYSTGKNGIIMACYKIHILLGS